MTLPGSRPEFRSAICRIPPWSRTHPDFRPGKAASRRRQRTVVPTAASRYHACIPGSGSGIPSSRRGPVTGRYQVVTGISSTTWTICGAGRARARSARRRCRAGQARARVAASPPRPPARARRRPGRRRRPTRSTAGRSPSASRIGPREHRPARRCGSARRRCRPASSRRPRRARNRSPVGSQASPRSNTPRSGICSSGSSGRDPGEQHPDLADAHSTAKPSRARARARPRRRRRRRSGPRRCRAAAGPSQPGFAPAQVDEDRLALGRGVELEHARRREALAATRRQSPRGIPEPMNSRTGWWCSPGCGGRLDEVVQHRPRVRGDRDAVAAHLLPERRGVEVACAIASRAPPAIAPPMLISSPDGW